MSADAGRMGWQTWRGDDPTILGAPGGYGKTCQVARWEGACRRVVTWIGVDEADDDTERLVEPVGGGLSRIG